MSTTLVIMAAGLGSRFGGCKQMTPVDPMGHVIIDYSIYDALRAGFGKIVCVIKPEMEADFRAAIGDRIARRAEVAYAYQTIDRLPEDMRTVLILSALENRPSEEIARITASPVGTVKSRLNRARVKLAEILSRMREPSAEKRVQHGERRTAP